MAKDLQTTMDAAEFSDYMDHINEVGLTSLLVSLGHQLGLFNLMMKHNKPMTSSELADLAGMKERYVREWLSGVACGKIVTFDPEAGTFYIPEDRHASLRRSPALAVGISAFAQRTEAVMRCFMKDGPYGFSGGSDETFWDFFSSMREGMSEVFTETCLAALRKTTVVDKLDAGIRVLDACCGSGEYTMELARKFPKSSFTALDFFEKPIAMVGERVQSSGLDNANVVQGDIHNLPAEMKEAFDMVLVIDGLHDLPDPYKALSEVHKVLKPHGVVVILEQQTRAKLNDNIRLDGMKHAVLYTWSVFNCLPSSLSGEARVGYGPCWGRENVEEAIKRHFEINHMFDILKSHVLYVSTKMLM